MPELEEKIDKLESYLDEVIQKLDKLTDDNFDKSFKKIQIIIKQIDETKEYLKNKFDDKLVKSKSDSVHSAIKQIRAKFDSIIEEKKEEQNKISSELANTANKKKLINYQR